MIHDIRAAFNELLADIDWMDDETRAVAKAKADAMNERIGYPEILTNQLELEKEYTNVGVIKRVDSVTHCQILQILCKCMCFIWQPFVFCYCTRGSVSRRKNFLFFSLIVFFKAYCEIL